jgi:hypothetical protein
MRFNIGIAAMLGSVLSIPVLAQSGANHVASGYREILLEATKSWNGTPYTHGLTAKPQQINAITLTLAPQTILPCHTHPFPNSGYVLSAPSPSGLAKAGLCH